MVPTSRVKPANSSEITQDGTCGTAVSLAQETGGQGRLRLEKRARVRSRDPSRAVQMLSTLPKWGQLCPQPPLGTRNPTCSHGWDMASASQESLESLRTALAQLARAKCLSSGEH